MNAELTARLKAELAAERYAKRKAQWTQGNRKRAIEKIKAQAKKSKRARAPLPPMVEAWLICQKYGLPWDNLNPWYGRWR